MEENNSELVQQELRSNIEQLVQIPPLEYLPNIPITANPSSQTPGPSRRMLFLSRIKSPLNPYPSGSRRSSNIRLSLSEATFKILITEIYYRSSGGGDMERPKTRGCIR